MFREMRRSKQALSQEDCLKVLETQKRGTLAVLGDEGYPYAVPIDFFYRDGKLYFHSAKIGHKMDALRAYDKVSFNVLSDPETAEGDWALWFNSVTCFGRMRIMEDTDEIIAMSRELSARFPIPQQELENEISQLRERVGGLELTIEHMTGKRIHEK